MVGGPGAGSEGGLQAVQRAGGSRRRGLGLATVGVQEKVQAALHSVIVLVGRGRRRGGGQRGGGGGRGGRGAGRGSGAAGVVVVALGGRVILGVRVIDEGDVWLGVLDAELGVGHEVVDGGA